jgi:predicted DCC family thiol-disulfide oxidoreductase YuxK
LSKVETLELEEKTSSANEIVTSIYKKAKKKNNSSQLIKSLLYLSKNTLILKEDAELEIVQVLEKEIKEADFPTNNILQSIVAEFKWEYLKKYRWQIYNRTKTTEIVNTDFRTWI